jgi:hypothetical protein
MQSHPWPVARSIVISSILLIVSFSWSHFVLSIPFYGADSAYNAAYSNSISLDSFPVFTVSQGYPCLPMWVFFLFCNLLNFSYETSIHFQGGLYSFVALLFPFVCSRFSLGKGPLLSFVVFSSFAVFGYFGIVLIASAFKMLFAFLFFILSWMFSSYEKKALSRLFVVLSLLSHVTIIILFAIVYHEKIYASLVALMRIVCGKIRLSFIYSAIIGLIAASFLFRIVFQKFTYNFLSGSSYETGLGGQVSICYAIVIISLWFSRSSTFSFLPFYVLIVPVFLPISLGRISWFYLFGLYFLHFSSFSSRFSSLQRIFFLLPFSAYYLVRSFNVLSARDLLF